MGSPSPPGPSQPADENQFYPFVPSQPPNVNPFPPPRLSQHHNVNLFHPPGLSQSPNVNPSRPPATLGFARAANVDLKQPIIVSLFHHLILQLLDLRRGLLGMQVEI